MEKQAGPDRLPPHFERYELKSGYMRPAPGARLIPGRAEIPSGDDPPYLSLLDAVSAYSSGRDEDAEHILAWCGQYGLLGILLHSTHRVVLPARWRKGSGRNVVPSQRQVWRVGREWYLDDRELAFPVTSNSKLGLRAGGLVTMEHVEWYFPHDEDSLLPVYPEEAHAVVTEAPYVPPVRRSLPESWGRFFPTIEASGDAIYPLPNDDAFWNLYAEPLNDFRQMVGALRESIEWAAQIENRTPGRRARRKAASSSNPWLEWLLQPVSPIPTVDERSRIVSWRNSSPSLLGSLAMMILLDRQVGRVQLVCQRPVCAKWFVRESHERKYCSEACQRAEDQRRRRARKNAARRGGTNRAKRISRNTR